MLFALVSFARHIGVNPDDALERTNKKFKCRFGYVEQCAKASQKGIQNLSVDEMIALWNEAKAKEKDGD